jgi:para-nitrobenzyl esterase
MKALLSIAVLGLLAGCGGGSSSTTSDVDHLEPRFAVRVTRGVVYGSGPVVEPAPAQVELRLDLYEPEGDGVEASPPGILLLHGGGFLAGDREDPRIAAIATELALRGYVAASIDYRLLAASPPVSLSPDFQGFAAIPFFAATAAEDAFAAYRWLLANTAADPERMFIGGASAGAVAGLTLAFSPDDVGVPDPPRFLGVLDLWGLIFQLDHVEAGEAAIFIVHGDADGTVPFILSEQLVTRATEVGVPLEFHRVTGADHGFANVPFFSDGPEPGVTYLDRLFVFLANQL